MIGRLPRRAAGWAAGAAVAYFFDPRLGAQRRERAAELITRFRHQWARTPDGSALPTDPVDLDELQSRFEREGITLAQHRVTPTSDVICGSCGATSAPEAMQREWRHRLEGATDPAAMATVSGLRCPACQELGMLTLPYGPQASARDAEVLRRLGEPATDNIAEAIRSERTVAGRVLGQARRLQEAAVSTWRQTSPAV